MIFNGGRCHNGENGENGISTVETNLGRSSDESWTMVGQILYGKVTGWSRNGHGHVTKNERLTLNFF